MMCFSQNKPAAKVMVFKDDRTDDQLKDANFERTLISVKKLSWHHLLRHLISLLIFKRTVLKSVSQSF